MGTYLFREAETRPGLSLSVRSVQRKAKRYHSHVATLRSVLLLLLLLLPFPFPFRRSAIYHSGHAVVATRHFFLKKTVAFYGHKRVNLLLLLPLRR